MVQQTTAPDSVSGGNGLPTGFPANVYRQVCLGEWCIVVHFLTPMWLYVQRSLGLPQSDLLGTIVACRSRDQGAGRA